MKSTKQIKQTIAPFLMAAMMMVGNLSVLGQTGTNAVHDALGFNTTTDPAGMAAKTQHHPLMKKRVEYMPVWELAVFGDNSNSGKLTYALYGHTRPQGYSSLNYLHSGSTGETSLGDGNRILASRSVPVRLNSSGKSDMIATYFAQLKTNGTIDFKLVIKPATSTSWNYVSQETYGRVFERSSSDIWKKGAIDNYLPIIALDFDGDGRDEIVVASCNAIYVFRNNGNGYAASNWAETILYESYAVTEQSKDHHTAIVFTKGDFDEDGKEDLAWVQSDLSSVNGDDKTATTGKSMGKFMLGKNINFSSITDKNQASNLTFNPSTTKVFYATGLTWADIDNDGQNELVVGGLVKNTSNDGKFCIGFTYQKWGTNSFGSNILVYEYTSDSFGKNDDKARAPMHIAVGRFGGISGTTYVLAGSRLFRRKISTEPATDPVFSMIHYLDDSDGDYFTNGSTNTAVHAGNFFGMDMTDQFVLVGYKHNDDPTKAKRRLYYIKNNSTSKNPVWSNLSMAKINTTPFTNSDNYALDACFVNTNNDTPIFEYIDHHKSYSDPKVFAAISAPPYFKDLEQAGVSSGYSTSMEISKSAGLGEVKSSSISVGAYLSFEQDIAVFGVKLGQVEAEASYKHAFGKEYVTERIVAEHRTFSTVGEDNLVVLYTIPTSVFRYKVYNPNSTGTTYTEMTTDIVIPYEPQLLSITEKQYMEIYNQFKNQPSTNVLPNLSTLFSHTAGRPDTYPTEDDITAKTKHFITNSPITIPTGSLCDGVGISIGTSGTVTTSATNTIDFKLGAGAGGVTVGVTGGYESKAGKVESWTNGETYEAQLCGITENLKTTYGYSFNWKLGQYYVTNGGYSFPFVTYAVSAAAQNPTLPDNISATSANNKITLNWAANSDTRTDKYNIYRSTTKGDDNGFLPTGYTKVAEDISRTTLTWTDNTATTDVDYYYKIQAIGNNGKNSIYSRAVSAKITSIPVTGVVISYNATPLANGDQLPTLYQDATLTLTAAVLPGNATNKNITWSSTASTNLDITPNTDGDSAVFKLINGQNVLSGILNDIKITATANGKTAECKLTLNFNSTPAITSVTVSPTSATILRGKTQQFTATVVTQGIPAPSSAVTWTVTGNNNANTKISTSGLLTVSIDETATTLTVTATSQFDSNKKSNATVNLQNSAECALLNIITPSDAIYNSTEKTIKHTVNSDIVLQQINIEVSQGATWALYSDEACTVNIGSMGLVVGSNVAYIKILAQNGTSSTKITVTITRKDGSLPGGTGDIDNPYQISTPQQLADFAAMVNDGTTCVGKYIVLINDIDLSAYNAGFNGGKGWIPIGNDIWFRGTFDGQGHTVSNLYINDPSVDYNGLFGYVHEGTVKNVGVANANITGRDYFGGVIGFLYASGTIDNCYVTGTIKGRDSGGGIVGGVRIGNNTVTNCYSSATVSGTANSIGGIAGYSYGKITNCYATGAISANGANAGGIVGEIPLFPSTGQVTNCAALNISVKSATYSGRVVGRYNAGTMSENIAFVGMLNNANTTVWNNKGSANTDGEDITALAINTDGTINGLFTNSNWTTADFKLPGLFGQTVDMPAHLIAPGIHAQLPTITTQPQDVNGLTGATISANVAANVTDGGTLTYQWYDGDGIITDATGVTCTVPTDVTGTYYYYVVIKNTITNNGDGGIKSVSVTSNVAIITVSEPAIITSVTVEPFETYMEIGKNLQFSAVVGYSGAPAQLVTGDIVTWSVTGNNSSGTTISANGLLTVANNETANTLTVTAVSTENTGIFNSATVTITNPDENFSGGTGEEEDPYIIQTPEDLEALALKTNGGKNYNGKYFIMIDNIDLSNYAADFNDGKGWIVIGNNSGKNFQGIFDGQGHTISNLYINDPTGSAKGLFGYLYAGTVKNTGLVNVNITARDNVGGIAGYANGIAILIENCYVTGTIKANDSGGSIVGAGQGQGVTINNCYSTADVSGDANSIGGIAGYTRGIITNCYTTGAITVASERAGGIVGDVTVTGKVINCAALNRSVKNATSAGRIAGRNDGTLSDNIAFDEMLNNENTTEWENKGDVNTDGEDMTKLDINSDGTINGLFANTDIWTTQNNRLPGLFGQSVDMPEHLRLVEMVYITTLSLPNGTVGTAYSELLEADGSTPITWSIESGNLPDGLSLTDNIISGTPAVAGTFNFTVKAQNSVGSDSKPLFIVIENEMGIDNVKENYITVYPNPTKDVLIIKNEELRMDNYSILNLAGQILIQGNLSGETTIINVKLLPSGMYFIKVGDRVGKFIKE